MDKKDESLYKKINNLSLPATILIASIVLGGFYYASQVSKQNSIEKQQRVEQLRDDERQKLSSKQNECESLSTGVKKKWNNVVGVTYSEIWDECVVTYTDPETGEIETSPLSLMADVN